MTVVTGARRRALRDGDRQIDTAHLLHSLIESDPEVGAAFEGGHQLARVLGYLVQRSIGYGLRWQRSVEDSGARRLLPAARGAESRDPRGSGWSPAASAALEEAFRRAAERGETQARGVDLLAVVAADPGSRAVEVLRRAGVDPGALAARAEVRTSGAAGAGSDGGAAGSDGGFGAGSDRGRAAESGAGATHAAALGEGIVPRRHGEPSQQV
ncbi:Clp protease N-terminal domain-containing protein [Streptomyces sp. NPDC017254]|uniref:Clp protease N-terminal domain-containing protein n=1 Tax=unclassified Streptomyces TaxID=2593676 RepID=UPI00378CFD25